MWLHNGKPVYLQIRSKRSSDLDYQSIVSEFLLVILLMTVIHQDLWNGKLVPSSHQRGKPSHNILCSFSRGDDRTWKGIPISDCLKEEWALVNVRFCSGVWKVNEWWFLLIWGIKSSVGMLAAPFRPLYKRVSLLSPLLFLRDFYFRFSSIPVILPVSKQ